MVDIKYIHSKPLHTPLPLFASTSVIRRIMHQAFQYLLVAFGTMPPARMLQHIPLIGNEVLPTAATPAGNYEAMPVNTLVSALPIPRPHIATLLGAGLPPIPAKIVSRIEAGEFIEMADLLPERLDPTRSLFIDEPEPSKTHKRRKTVTKILAVLCHIYRNILQEIPREIARYAKLSYLDNSESYGI